MCTRLIGIASKQGEDEGVAIIVIASSCLWPLKRDRACGVDVFHWRRVRGTRTGCGRVASGVVPEEEDRARAHRCRRRRIRGRERSRVAMFGER